jgi:hypothetical protein
MSMMPGQDFQRRLDTEYPAAMERHQAELARPFSRVPRRTRVIALVILAALAVFVAIGVWTMSRPQQTTSGQGAATALASLTAALTHTPSGTTVDLAKVLAIAWDQAFLIPAGSTGDDMNRRLGFSGYAPGDLSPKDPATQFIVLTLGAAIVAQIELPPTGVQFDHAVEGFTRADATFVVSRATGTEVLRRP